MITEIEKLIESVYRIPFSPEGAKEIEAALQTIRKYIISNHFLKANAYLKQLDELCLETNDLSYFFSDDDDKLHQRKIQKSIASLARQILDENKKIFVVHGRNIGMRDKVSALLGKLKLDHVVLESEHNGGLTVIEKFLRSSQDCRYAVVLFSGDDVGKLNAEHEQLRTRTRQNVVLELGFFLAKVGRKNIAILHETGKELEKPSDFDGIVYEPFDEYGGWKGKLIKEMRKAGIYIDQNLADRA